MGQAKFFYKNSNAPKPNKPNSIGICAVIEHDGRVLLERRADSDRWALIGGELNVDESLEQGLIREINEETGLVVDEMDLVFWKIYSDPSRIVEFPDGNVLRIITAVYLLKVNSISELICSEESLELCCFSYDELREVNIAETHKHIVDEYLMIKGKEERI
ncbi:MAG: NUDIX domain-containing protein [Clostridium sp.]|uniref:NUDIX domain-containing protein n=1 Tax=Clostridium sp. TaxID=1506 RepID=UPI00306A1875